MVADTTPVDTLPASVREGRGMATTMDARAPSVREAFHALLPQGSMVHALRLWGSDTLLFRRLDQREHDRRHAAAAGRLDRIGPLEALMALPVGIPVPLRSLDQRLRKAVRALPVGAAEVADGSVTRLAVRPMRAELAVVRARSWRDGLEAAGRFAPVCRRAMLLERETKGLDQLQVEAAYYGIGVLMPREQGLEMVVEPALYRPARHTAAAWLFVEEIYQQIEQGRAET